MPLSSDGADGVLPGRAKAPRIPDFHRHFFIDGLIATLYSRAHAPRLWSVHPPLRTFFSPRRSNHHCRSRPPDCRQNVGTRCSYVLRTRSCCPSTGVRRRGDSAGLDRANASLERARRPGDGSSITAVRSGTVAIYTSRAVTFFVCSVALLVCTITLFVCTVAVL